MALDTYASGAILIVLSTLAGVGGLLLVHRWVNHKILMTCHEVGGYLLSVVGTLYAVLLGLIVVEAMSRFESARQTTDQEANALANVVLYANGLPPAKRRELADLAARYAHLVIEDEWRAMDDGHDSPAARRAAYDLVRAVCEFEPRNERESAVYSAELDAAGQLWNNRRVRIVTAHHGVPRLQWVVLIVGGMITIAFTYFFKIEHLRIQLVMTGLVSALISLNIYLVGMFGYPFSGDLKVDADTFRLAQAVIEERVENVPASPGR